MKYQQRELCLEATESIDTALDCLQDLAGELAAESGNDEPVLAAILDALLVLKLQVRHAGRTGEFPPPVPPNQLSLDMPNGKP